eukprot:CAMPEP_0118663086 /NCGR_PEP_ID=MMETSP0785-20121206/17203_1 /TAXON_ID=91992 /ORGANISM="Bolidomonas pacifica, Strain CCMP 1866" /LENGTH=61 /DNA_ID=CAMNT_0006556725 /DNA_START=20 /DNA_END=201 /DNA_ORIENTATION=+
MNKHRKLISPQRVAGKAKKMDKKETLWKEREEKEEEDSSLTEKLLSNTTIVDIDMLNSIVP